LQANATDYFWLYSDFPTAEYAKYQAGYAFYPDFKCAEFCQFLYNISVCKGFIMNPQKNQPALRRAQWWPILAQVDFLLN